MDVGKTLIFVTTVVTSLIIISNLIPPALDMTFGTEDTRDGLEEGETVSIHDDINVTCDEHNTTEDYVILTFEGPSNNDTITVDLGEEEHAELEPVDGDEKMRIGAYYYHQDSDEALIEFSVPNQFDWDRSTRAISSTLTIVFMLVILMSIASVLIYVIKRG